MNYNQIDVLEKGTVWQGGSVDSSIDQAPFVGPLMIVCMDAGESNEQFIDHQIVQAVLSVWIQDEPTGRGPLDDNVLLALVNSAAAWLENGGNLYIHCVAGVSRASYFDIALHCVVNKWSYQQAYNTIKAQRSIIDPNAGFVAQLQRLFP